MGKAIFVCLFACLLQPKQFSAIRRLLRTSYRTQKKKQKKKIYFYTHLLVECYRLLLLIKYRFLEIFYQRTDKSPKILKCITSASNHVSFL
jgi:hypothetical protein